MRRQPDATVLAFDFGTRRIGVAFANTVTRVAHPLTTIDMPHGTARFDAISSIVAEWRPAQLVVGLPVHADGTPHAMTARAQGFAEELASRFKLPVAVVDERWTSEAAAHDLRAAGHGGRAGRVLRDEAAARIILQAWLDEKHDC